MSNINRYPKYPTARADTSP